MYAYFVYMRTLHACTHECMYDEEVFHAIQSLYACCLYMPPCLWYAVCSRYMWILCHEHQWKQHFGLSLVSSDHVQVLYSIIGYSVCIQYVPLVNSGHVYCTVHTFGE